MKKKIQNLVVFGNIESKKLIIILKFTQRQNSKKKRRKIFKKQKHSSPPLLPLSHLLLFQKGGVAQLIWMPRPLTVFSLQISEASSNNMQIELYSLNDKSRKKKQKNKPELLLIRNVPQLHVYECLNKREKKLNSKSRFFFNTISAQCQNFGSRGLR